MAPGDPTVLKPGGLHVMLMELGQALEGGDVLSLTLTLENAGEVMLNLPIHSMTAGSKHQGGSHKPAHDHSS